MAGPPPRRLARAPARLAADPLRGEGPGRRPLARLSPNQTPPPDHNQKLSHSSYVAASAASLQRGLSQRLKSAVTKPRHPQTSHILQITTPLRLISGR